MWLLQRVWFLLGVWLDDVTVLQVCAVSAAGRGDFSPPGVLSTPAVRPSPPLYVYVTGKPTQTTIPIQWGMSMGGGSS